MLRTVQSLQLFHSAFRTAFTLLANCHLSNTPGYLSWSEGRLTHVGGQFSFKVQVVFEQVDVKQTDAQMVNFAQLTVKVVKITVCLLFVLTRMEISFPEIAKMKVSRYICQSHKL